MSSCVGANPWEFAPTSRLAQARFIQHALRWVLLVYLALAGLTRAKAGSYSATYDIVAEGAITYDGTIEGTNASGRALILPNPSTGGGEVCGELRAVFLPHNSFPLCGSFTFRTASGCHGTIAVNRAGKRGVNGSFSLAPGSAAAVRGLSWADLRDVQKQFVDWLYDKSGVNWLCHPKSGARRRFGLGFEHEVTVLWLKCLENSRFDALVGGGHFEKLTATLTPPSSAGAMGLIPLRAGMRLRIDWGGTADYMFGQQYVSRWHSRQTTTGTSYLEILAREQKLTLTPLGEKWKATPLSPRSSFPEPDRGGARTQAPGSPAPASGLGAPSAAPMAGAAVPAAPGAGASSAAPPADFGSPNDLLPFGTANTHQVLAIFNEFDLRFLKEGLGQYPALCLFVPSDYPKADFTEQANSRFTHDARAETHEAGLTSLTATAVLRSRFILAPADVAPAGGPSEAADFDRLAAGQPYRPLVFGNQTFVSVEIPIAVGAESLEWTALGTTLQDWLSTHGAWAAAAPLRDHDKFAPFLKLRRAPRHPGGEAPEYRFYTAPAAALAGIELSVGDHLSLTP